MPSVTLRPRSATHTPDFAKIFGECTAEGLPGCSWQYNSARCLAAMFSRNSGFIYALNVGSHSFGLAASCLTMGKGNSESGLSVFVAERNGRTQARQPFNSI